MITKLIDDVMQQHGQRPPGIEYGIPDKQYRGGCRMNPSSLSAGLMSANEVDPAAIRLAFESGDPDRAQAAQDRMDRGTLAHLAILQPELVRERVAVWTGAKRAGGDWDKFQADNPDKLIIRRDDYDEVMHAANRVLELPELRAMLAGAQTEVSLYAEDGTGADTVYCMGRVDAIVNKDCVTIIPDLKTTDAGIDHKSVEWTIRDLKYREKMAMYRRMYLDITGDDPELVQCHLLFVRMKQPIAVRLVKISTGALEYGEWRMKQAIDAVRTCIKSGNWPVYMVRDVVDVAEWELPDEEKMEPEYD